MRRTARQGRCRSRMTTLKPLGDDHAAAPSAVIYLRVSTKEQSQRDGDPEGYSIPAQRDACRRKAESLGATMVEEFGRPWRECAEGRPTSASSAPRIHP